MNWLCLFLGHDTGRCWYWDKTRKQFYRDYRYCERCKKYL